MSSCVHPVLEHLCFCERHQNVLRWKLNFVGCKWLSYVSVLVNICRIREDKTTVKQESYILQESCEYIMAEQVTLCLLAVKFLEA